MSGRCVACWNPNTGGNSVTVIYCNQDAMEISSERDGGGPERWRANEQNKLKKSAKHQQELVITNEPSPFKYLIQISINIHLNIYIYPSSKNLT